MSAATPADRRWLDAAVRFARPHLGTTGLRPVAAALVVDAEQGVVLSRAIATETRDAGSMALADAAHHARGATLFTTMEPSAAPVLTAGIARVVIGVRNPDRAHAGQAMAELRAAMVDVTLVEHAPSRELVAPYLARLARGRPDVTAIVCLSADDRIAHADGSPIEPGEPARRWLAAELTHAEALLVALPGDALAIRRRGADGVPVPPRNGRFDVTAIMAAGFAADIVSLTVMPDARLAEALIAQGVVDRFQLIRTPEIVGRSGMPATILGDLQGRLRAARLVTVSRTLLGEDGLDTFEPEP